MNEHFNKAKQLYKEGNAREAISELQRAINKEPTNTKFFVTLGIILEGQGKSEEAVAVYRRATKIDANEPTANLQLGLLLSHMGKYDAAVAPLRKAWSSDQKSAKIANALARALDEAQEFDEAQVMYESVIKLDPGLEDAQYNLATLRFNDHKYESAIAHYVAYMVKAGESSKAHRNIGKALAAIGELDSALHSFDKAKALSRNDSTIYYSIADVYERKSDLASAIENYRCALEIDPQYHEARFELAKCLRNNNAIDDAIAEFKILVQKCPSHYRAMNGLGTCYLALKDGTSAARIFRQAIEIAPGFAAGQYNMGLALRSAGHLDEAQVHFIQANRLDPSYKADHPTQRYATASVPRN